MTIRELIYDVREMLNQYSDDSDISDRYILHLLNLKRSKYLRNDLNNFQKTKDTSTLQTFCIGVEEVSAEKCGTSYECDTIMRTVSPIPKPLDLNLGSAITSVKSVKRLDNPFNFVTKERALFSKYSQFENTIYVYLDDDMYLYLISKSNVIKMLECITVTGVFENPEELKNFSDCCGCSNPTTCFDEDTTEYPIPAHHSDNIRNEIIDLLVNKFKMPTDRANDGTPEQTV